MYFLVLWSGLISFIHGLGEINNGLIAATSSTSVCADAGVSITSEIAVHDSPLKAAV